MKRTRLTQDVRNAIRDDRRHAREIAMEHNVSMNLVYQIRGTKREELRREDPDGFYATTVEERGWKRCGLCKEQLDLDKFYRDKSGSGGYSSRCKPCDNARKALKENAATRNKQSLIRHVKNHPCERCTLSWPSYVMQFDHLPEHEKRFEISGYRNAPLTDLALEIAKCQLLCANCHAVVSHERRGVEQDTVELTVAAKHYLETVLPRFL